MTDFTGYFPAIATGILAVAGGILCLLAQKARRDTVMHCEALRGEFAATLDTVKADHGRLEDLLLAARERARSAETERAAAIRDREVAVALLDLAVSALEDFDEVPDARQAALASIRKGAEPLRPADTPIPR